MVGCGALGCEFMKNFALNNICCGVDGKLIVTDADRIELSNLSRQFLFREHNVGQPKSIAASKMATVMNGGFNVEALEMFVGPKTEVSGRAVEYIEVFVCIYICACMRVRVWGVGEIEEEKKLF